MANKQILTPVFAILNLIMYLAYTITPMPGVIYTLYVLLSILNTLLIPLLAVQAVEDATSPELELVQRKLSRKNKIPVQRLFLAILIAALIGIPTGYRTGDIVMAAVLLLFNLLSFSWFVYEHGSDYRAIMASGGRVKSKEQKIDSSRLISESENELVVPISDSKDDLEIAESESDVVLDWKIVCTSEALYDFLSKLPRLFYYSYYWCLLTVVLIYMYQLSCQFGYSKLDLNPSYLRVYPLLFTVVSYPVIEWKILPVLKLHKTFHKLSLSTLCAVLTLVVATTLESFRVTQTYGTNYYDEDPTKDQRVSSCPVDLGDYCTDVPTSSNQVCDYPPMMSNKLNVGWQSIQFLLLSFSISLTGSSFIDFCFYEFFPSSPFISITLSTGLIRFFMCVAILLQFYDADPSRIGNYLTFNLNEENIPILLIYASLFIGFFGLYLFIDHFPFQEYYDYWCGESGESNTNETTPFLSSSAPPPYNPVAAAAPAQPETIIPFQPLREYVPIVPERINNTEEEGDEVPKSSPEIVVDEEDAVEFDQKCKEIVELVGSVLVKPLKDLTAEQTVLFFKSVGCLGIEDVLKEKRIVLSGKDLNNVETLEDLISLDLNLPRIKAKCPEDRNRGGNIYIGKLRIPNQKIKGASGGLILQWLTAIIAGGISGIKLNIEELSTLKNS
eukprot:gene7245-7819_t